MNLINTDSPTMELAYAKADSVAFQLLNGDTTLEHFKPHFLAVEGEAATEKKAEATFQAQAHKLGKLFGNLSHQLITGTCRIYAIEIKMALVEEGLSCRVLKDREGHYCLQLAQDHDLILFDPFNSYLLKQARENLSDPGTYLDFLKHIVTEELNPRTIARVMFHVRPDGFEDYLGTVAIDTETLRQVKILDNELVRFSSF